MPLGQKVPSAFAAFIATGGEVVAHNIAFDAPILARGYGIAIPLLQMIDTRAKCAMNNVPLSLKDAANFLDLPFKKMTKGRLLIAKLSKPKSTDPLVWREDSKTLEQMYEYNRQDVEVCRAIDKRLPDLTPFERLCGYRDWETHSLS